MNKIIKNLRAAAFIFIAVGTVSAFAASSYEHCRCNQTAPGLTDNTSTCCGDSTNNSYQNSNKDTCCKNVKGSTYSWTGTGTTWSSSGCTAAADCSKYTTCSKASGGGFVPQGTDSGQAACNTCCGTTGSRPGAEQCGGNWYVACQCPTITCTMIQDWTVCNPSNAACQVDSWDNYDTEATTAQINGMSSGTYYDVKGGNPQVTGPYDSTFGTGGSVCTTLSLPNCLFTNGVISTSIQGMTFRPGDANYSKARTCTGYGDPVNNPIIVICLNSDIAGRTMIRWWTTHDPIYYYRKYQCS